MVEQARLAPMRVCIFSPEAGLRDGLDLYTTNTGYRVEQVFDEPDKLAEFVVSSSIDHIIVVDVRHQGEERLRLIKELCAERPLAIVAIASKDDARFGERVITAGAQSLLIDPVRAQDLPAAFTVAVHQQAKQARLEEEVRHLREKLAERKLIEKAKGILMDSANVSEAEAFRLMQKQSQDKRRPMVEIAELIISATDLVREARGQAE